MYVTNDPADTVNYYDFDTGTSAEINLGFGVAPHSIAITPDGFTVYLSSNTNDIYLIDVLSNQVRPMPHSCSMSGQNFWRGRGSIPSKVLGEKKVWSP